MMPEYIFDTSALSNLAKVGRLELLEKRYQGNGFTTVEVSDELRRGILAGYDYLQVAVAQIEGIAAEGWLRVLVPESPAERRLRSEFDHILDPGESSCLALAISRELTLVTDDLAARQVAKERGVCLTGTLGILIASVRDGALSLAEANAALAAMIQKRYRSPVDRLDDLI